MIARVKQLVSDRARSGDKASRTLLDLAGFGGHWIRRAMNDDIDEFLRGLPVESLEAAEISGRHFAPLGWSRYEVLEYPGFDVCRDGEAYAEQFDVVFCEQVLEHVWRPQAALENLFVMLKPGGTLIVSTPFLVKIHKCPDDFWRFSPDCLRRMLEEAGFDVAGLQSWGNRACVRANSKNGSWAKYYPWRPLRNEADLPVAVWAYARRPPVPVSGAE